MPNLTRRDFMYVSAGALCALTLSGCAPANESTVVIYSCGEGGPNELLLAELHRDLPEHDIRLHYVSTGTCAAKLKIEGSSSEADIVLMLEGGYLRQIQPSLAKLTGYDFNVFENDLLDGSCTYLPFRRESACIAMNVSQLEKRGLPIPSSYDELLNPIYKNLIAMANPKSSGTGYNFLKNFVNERGEQDAFEYFDELTKNIYQFSSSGSGPVNALVQGEALIGFGLTFQTVSEINQGVPLEARFFAEGSPWTMNGVAVVEGKQDKVGVRVVMDWMYTRGILLDKQNFVPDKVFVNQDSTVENYPDSIRYANMDGVFDIEEKQRLLKKWKY